MKAQRKKIGKQVNPSDFASDIDDLDAIDSEMEQEKRSETRGTAEFSAFTREIGPVSANEMDKYRKASDRRLQKLIDRAIRRD